MGVLGFRLLSSFEVLYGTCTHYYLHDGQSDTTEDWDWNMVVHPSPECEDLLLNRSRTRNENGQIECEITPSGRPKGQAMQDHIGHAVGNAVIVAGPLVEDVGHGYKTEIHPIYALQIVGPEVEGNRRVDLLVFSDNSGALYIKNPAGRALGKGSWDLPGLDLVDRNVQAVFEVRLPLTAHPYPIAEANAAVDRGFEISAEGNIKRVRVSVHSGQASGGKGFYHGTWDVPAPTLKAALRNRGVDPKAGIRAALGGEGRGSIKSFLAAEAAFRLVSI